MSGPTLDRLAAVLLEAFDTNEHGATLLRIDDDGSGEFDIGLMPIDCHPVDALEVVDVPASCTALGVATGGWSAPISDLRPSAHPDAQRIFQVVLVDRAGTVASRVRYPDGSVLTAPPSEGAVLDALRTALRRAVAA